MTARLTKEPRMLQNDPIFHVQSVDAFKLRSNHWNPNVVFNKELDLLAESILSTGWVHPIIGNKDMLIIDGFHRTHLAKTHPGLLDRYEGEVPFVALDLPDREAMMMTVRINRAKGTHAALRMSDLVLELIDVHDATPDELIQKMGMTPGEVQLLYDRSLLKSRDLQNWNYSKAWKPIETRNLSKEERLEFERSQEDNS